ncbi:MAG TPA: hypothetical protein VH763_10995 [Gemmatimonadales bacterium]|jgi:hypothetical protein
MTHSTANRGLLLSLTFASLLTHSLEGQQSSIQAAVHGLVLVNAFYNDAKVNNSDVPQLALRPDPLTGPPASAAGATVRQSRVTVVAAVPEFAGGTLRAELDVDFFGGQQPSSGGRTFPLLRIRRAFAELTGRQWALFVGQESPPIAEVNPSSLASIGIPGFGGAGNLWLWIPQVRASADLPTMSGVRLGLELAALAPTSGEPQSAFLTQPDIAERSSRPYLEGRVRARWGDGEQPAEVSVGGHYGWLATGPDRRVHTKAVAASAWVPLTKQLELRGEAFTGEALAGLGGGGIGQSFGRDSLPVSTTGGWIQLNLRPSLAWEIGAGGGIDDPDDADLDLQSQRLRNITLEAHLLWRKAPIVLGGEVRRTRTRYGNPLADLDFTHLNLAAGFEF